MWLVLAYLPRPVVGMPPTKPRHVVTPESIFGPFDTKEEAGDWAAAQPFASWTVKAACPAGGRRRGDAAGALVTLGWGASVVVVGCVVYAVSLAVVSFVLRSLQ